MICRADWADMICVAFSFVASAASVSGMVVGDFNGALIVHGFVREYP